MVALALRTPYESPWLIDSTAPEPGETAIRQEAAKNANQVWKSIANTAMRSRGGQHHSAFFAKKVALRQARQAQNAIK